MVRNSTSDFQNYFILEEAMFWNVTGANYYIDTTALPIGKMNLTVWANDSAGTTSSILINYTKNNTKPELVSTPIVTPYGYDVAARDIDGNGNYTLIQVVKDDGFPEPNETLRVMSPWTPFYWDYAGSFGGLNPGNYTVTIYAADLSGVKSDIYQQNITVPQPIIIQSFTGYFMQAFHLE